MVDSRLVMGGSLDTSTLGSAVVFPGPLEFTPQAVQLTDAQVQAPYRTAGVFSKLFVNCTGHTTNLVITMRNNAANGNETVTLSATGNFEDTLNTDTATVGNKYDYSGSNNSCIIQVIANTFAATTNTACRLAAAYLPQNASTSIFFCLEDGGFTGNTTESKAQTKMQKAGTLTNLFSNNLVSNTTASTFNSRSGGGPGNLTLSIPGSSTGIVEDTTHLDTISSGTLVDLELTTGTGTMALQGEGGCDFTSTNGDSVVVNGNSAVGTLASSSSLFLELSGVMDTDTTESHTQCTARDVFTATNLTSNFTTNTVSTTVRFRNATANGNQVITSSTTGQLADTTNTDTTTATGLVDFEVVTGATGPVITSISDWFNISGAVVAPTLTYVWKPSMIW